MSKVSNSIRSSVENPLNIAKPTAHSQHNIPTFTYEAKSASNFTNTQSHLFGPRNEFASKSEAQFGKVRRAKLGEPIVDDEVLANRDRYKRELDLQVRDNQRQKRYQEFENKKKDNGPIMPSYEDSTQLSYRSRNVDQLYASDGNPLALDIERNSKATVKWEPRFKPKEDNTDRLFEEMEREKRMAARRRRNNNQESFFDAFGRQQAPPNPSLNHTDVTREKLLNVEPLRRADPDSYKSYYDELSKQVKEKQQNKESEKLRSLEADENHTKQFNNYWQKPGHGASTGNPRRQNLMGNLISPRYGPEEIEEIRTSPRRNH